MADAMLSRVATAIAALFSYAVALLYAWWSLAFPRRARRRRLEARLREAADYSEWVEVASLLDRCEGNDRWREEAASPHYDAVALDAQLRALREARAQGDVSRIIFLLRTGMSRNMAGLDNARLFQQSYVGTKRLIESYIDEFNQLLHVLCNEITFSGEHPGHAKERFFYDARQAFGRSALLLSGGASFGMYHFGVVKCLYEFNLLPRVVSGSSIGAVVVAFLGTHTDEELPRFFQPGAIHFEAFDKLDRQHSVRRKVTRLLKHGYLMDIGRLEAFLRSNIGDVTFQEAYAKTRRIINITVASTERFEMPRLLNYLTAPNVLIWSAALASCASPGMYEPVRHILAKDPKGAVVPWGPSRHKWSDSSLEQDLPMARLSELFNVNQFIVSQVNPHVIGFLPSTSTISSRWRSRAWEACKMLLVSELHHRVLQLAQLGLLPKFMQPVFTQKYQGDITIVPDLGLAELRHALQNPSEATLLECMRVGERSTWPFISMIRTRCKIELTLEQCYRRARAANASAHEIEMPYPRPAGLPPAGGAPGVRRLRSDTPDAERGLRRRASPLGVPAGLASLCAEDARGPPSLSRRTEGAPE